MKNREKKVIILDNLASPFIAQAIIILKENAPEREDNILREAEQIVAGYFPAQKNTRPLKKQSFLAVGICLALLLILAAFLVMFS